LNFFVGDDITCLSLTNPLTDQGEVIFLKRQSLIDGFIDHEAAIPLL
jgi:hypothetical protein